MDGASVTALLADLLFQPNRVTHAAIAACDPHALAGAAEREQIVPQVLAAIRAIDRNAALDSHAAALRDVARRVALQEALEHEAISRWLARLDSMPVLFFKGAALAYSLYEKPSQRMRVDWDVLIGASCLDKAGNALEAAGFVREVKVPLGVRTRQQSYRRALGTGDCVVDLHTGVVNAPALADRMTFQELWQRRHALASLHPQAYGLDDADALAVACVHRLVHHSGEGRLVWDYDISLLAARMDASETARTELEVRCARWGTGPLVAVEVARVTAQITSRPAARDEWIDRLASQPSDLMTFATPNRSRGGDFLLDLRTAGWRDRLAYVREVLFPPAGFVRASTGSSLPLPLLYARRIARGARRWLTRPSSRRPT